MNTITKLLVCLILSITISKLQAQTKDLDSIRKEKVDYKIVKLEEERSQIEEQEKGALKLKIQKINARLDADEITAAEAENLKKEAAKIAVLNIENRTVIIDKQIALLRRNGYDAYQYRRDDDEKVELNIGSNGLHINIGSEEKAPKYDLRTTNKMLFAIGFNNTIIDGENLDDSPYKIGGSGFVELGWLWQTRLFKDSNFMRVNYGFSFQWNKLNMKDNQYFVQTDDVTSLQEFPVDLDKAQFRVTNLVVPMHLEFGPSKKREFKDKIRYTTENQFKFGIGGYGGLRLGTLQKLKYKENGDRVKDKIRKNYNTSNFVYGLSAYVGFDDVSLYVKYDLNPLFKDQAVDQNNISVGLRFDLD
ncbi:hypothetical protein HNV08_04980 [Winogradskyella eckloniae]|uniref:hypothetical protein n=1 Tax=Winogradskyella eckloniae TaxID=1089306 RepID=UPI001566FAE2|nr:hypothetical protein [Winogradskyella eckloniae]NRD19392.1 hypothetical protein [Winogradskyella eckloniae]